MEDVLVFSKQCSLNRVPENSFSSQPSPQVLKNVVTSKKHPSWFFKVTF